MNETRVQEWLASLCSTQKSAVEGIVVHASSAGTVAVAQWSRDTYSAMETLQRTAESAMRVHQAIVETVQRAPEPQSDTGRVVAVPLMRDNKAIGGLALCFDELGPDAAGDVIDALSASAALMMSEAGAFRPVQSVAQSDLVLQLQAAILSQPHADEAAATFATRLAQLFECARVSVGFVENGYARVSAFSHGTVPDARQALGRTIAAAMDEAIAQAATLSLPPASETPRITLAHADLHRISGGPVCSIPVVNFGVITGAVTLEWPSGRVPNGGELARCEHIISLVGPVLALKVETDIGGVARVRRWCAQQWDRLTTPGELPFRFAVIGGALLLGFFLWVPMPYSISAPTRLEGSVQRALVAASDGFIQQTSVRPGDRVKEGQVLAELAQHDLQLERSKRDSELAQYANAYGAAFARADRSLLMVNQAKMAEARAQLELVEQQIERAQIKAPFDGVIISGDLTQSLGAPIQRGAVLMVVAPIDQYRLIVEVDERDIGDVKVGVEGRVALAAMPETLFTFRVDRVTPLAVTREGRHFYEVEGKLDAPSAALRPGLQGVARIDADKRPLASMALGHVLNGLRLRLWSWGWLG